MRKTNKADLCHALESDVTSISQLTPFDRSSTVLVQDGMVLLQSMNVKAFKTFGDLAEHFINVSSNVSQVLQLLLGYLTDTIKSYLLNLLN
jgi:hypothetical protein